MDSIHIECRFLRILTLFSEVGNFISLSILLTEKKRWQGLKQSTARILSDSPLLGWFSAYLRNLTRVQVSAFAHQEMVSVPQSRLTDLLRTETFLSLPFLPPLPHPSLTRKGLSCPEGSLGIRVCLAAPGEWPPISTAAPLRQESGSPGAGGGKREVWVSHGWIARGQGALYVLSSSAPQGPARGLCSPIKGAGPEPKLDFSLRCSARSCRFSGLHFCLLKPIGKVNEISMAKHPGFWGGAAREELPLRKFWPGHGSW